MTRYVQGITVEWFRRLYPDQIIPRYDPLHPESRVEEILKRMEVDQEISEFEVVEPFSPLDMIGIDFIIWDRIGKIVYLQVKGRSIYQVREHWLRWDGKSRFPIKILGVDYQVSDDVVRRSLLRLIRTDLMIAPDLLQTARRSHELWVKLQATLNSLKRSGFLNSLNEGYDPTLIAEYPWFPFIVGGDFGQATVALHDTRRSLVIDRPTDVELAHYALIDLKKKGCDEIASELRGRYFT